MLAELPEDADQAAVLQYIAQEYRRLAEQQESSYGAIELGRKLVQEAAQICPSSLA